jgi:nucleotide-binding universal stress UspA family protein
VRYALALAQAASLDVCLLHVNTLLQHDAADTCSGSQHVQDILTLTAAQAAVAGTHHDIILGSGNIVTAIVETAAAKACSVIVLGVAPYSGWQRLVYRHTVRAVLASTTLPLLLLNRSVTYMWILSSAYAREVMQQIINVILALLLILLQPLYIHSGNVRLGTGLLPLLGSVGCLVGLIIVLHCLLRPETHRTAVMHNLTAAQW